VPRSKNEWSYTSTPPYAIMACCSVKVKVQSPYKDKEPPRYYFGLENNETEWQDASFSLRAGVPTSL
jgi:hypothetical protein